MNKSREDTLKEIVNASGFVFQLGIEDQVRKSDAEHGWEVVAREYPWSVGERSGFADLILEKGAIRFVIECKRPRGANWVFLIPAGTGEGVGRGRLQWAEAVPKLPNLLGWDDFNVSPVSVESEFCVIRGQGEGDRPLLERLSADLLQSLPSLANDDLHVCSSSQAGQAWIYVPVIVTTAKLEICRFSASSVDTIEGTLEQTMFETVPFLRFRKSLAHNLNEHVSVSSLKAVSADKMRTIMVVNSEHLIEFLKEFAIGPQRWHSEWPWVMARRITSRVQVNES